MHFKCNNMERVNYLEMFKINPTAFIEDEGNCLVSLPVELIINPIAKKQWIGSFLK